MTHDDLDLAVERLDSISFVAANGLSDAHLRTLFQQRSAGDLRALKLSLLQSLGRDAEALQYALEES